MANAGDILGWVNMGEPFFMILSSYRWARGLSVPPREKCASAKEAPAKNMNCTLPKTY